MTDATPLEAYDFANHLTHGQDSESEDEGLDEIDDDNDEENDHEPKNGDFGGMIVTSKLNVSGKLQMDENNGNTKVYINGRQIAKVEVKVLKVIVHLLAVSVISFVLIGNRLFERKRGDQIEEYKYYVEFWIRTHISKPSFLEGTDNVSLMSWILQNPSFLGDVFVEKW